MHIEWIAYYTSISVLITLYFTYLSLGLFPQLKLGAAVEWEGLGVVAEQRQMRCVCSVQAGLNECDDRPGSSLEASTGWWASVAPFTMVLIFILH